MNQPPYGTYGAPPSPGYGPPGVDAASKVSLPATLMMVFAGLAILVSLVMIGLNVLGAGLGAGLASGSEEMVGQLISGVAGIVSYAISMLFNAVVLFGAMKMKKLESHTFALVSAILFALPCSFCCLVNTPIGIWAIITLVDSNVKAAFRS